MATAVMTKVLCALRPLQNSATAVSAECQALQPRTGEHRCATPHIAPPAPAPACLSGRGHVPSGTPPHAPPPTGAAHGTARPRGPLVGEVSAHKGLAHASGGAPRAPTSARRTPAAIVRRPRSHLRARPALCASHLPPHPSLRSVLVYCTWEGVLAVYHTIS